MRGTRLAVGLLCLILSPVAAYATTARRIEPTGGANLIAYQLDIGSTMKRDSDAEELFADDARAQATFIDDAKRLIVQQLEARGIAAEYESLTTKAPSHFLVGIWGHKIAGNPCAETYVYYVHASGAHQTGDGEYHDTWEWTALNSAPAGELGTALLKDLKIALEDYLSDRPSDKERERVR